MNFIRIKINKKYLRELFRQVSTPWLRQLATRRLNLTLDSLFKRFQHEPGPYGAALLLVGGGGRHYVLDQHVLREPGLGAEVPVGGARGAGARGAVGVGRGAHRRLLCQLRHWRHPRLPLLRL